MTEFSVMYFVYHWENRNQVSICPNKRVIVHVQFVKCVIEEWGNAIELHRMNTDPRKDNLKEGFRENYHLS